MLLSARHTHAFLFLAVLVVMAAVYSCDAGPTAVDAQSESDGGTEGSCSCNVPDSLEVEITNEMSVRVANEPTVHIGTAPSNNLFDLVVSGKLTQHVSTVDVVGNEQNRIPIAIAPGHVFITRAACQMPTYTVNPSEAAFIVENAFGDRVLTLVPRILAQNQNISVGTYQRTVTTPFAETFDPPIYVNNVDSQAGLELFKGFSMGTPTECDFTYYVYDPDA